MKQTAAILLLLLLAFNWVGYRLLTACLENTAVTHLQSKLDRDQYDRSALISIKVPVSHLAYYNTSPSFEKVDGRVTINGKTYQYVERRLWNDSLELLCMPNDAVNQIEKSSNEFFKLVNGFQNNSRHKQNDNHSNTFKSFITECYLPNNTAPVKPVLITTPLKRLTAETSLLHRPLSTPERPPDANA